MVTDEVEKREDRCRMDTADADRWREELPGIVEGLVR